MAKDYRVNRAIRVPEVLLIDDEGNQIGVVPIRKALEMADERSLDLVEVAPAAKPPVCRIMDYGKFQYQIDRREREARKVQKSRATNELREVRFKTRIGEHDREAKVRLIRRLLEEGAKVKVSVLFRGREITHPEFGMNVLKTVTQDLVDDALMEKPPAFEGRFLSIILTPNHNKPARPQNKETKSAEAKDA
ncbi:MAG: translation initiation factor IF-3 [SAR202 cluster bacterium]|nr:translation initiation factor IF-3 [SAR202 cluster bacterium]